MVSFKSLLITVLVLSMSLPGAQASAHWNGPVDAAIDSLAAFLQSMGLEGAGVRPFGYGFKIEFVENDGGRNLRQNRKGV